MFALLVHIPDNAVAQVNDLTRASNYLYLDHWAYPYITYLQERGRLNDLYRMVRPYSRLAVAENLDSLDPGALNNVETHLVSVLKDEFAAELLYLTAVESSETSTAFSLGAETSPSLVAANSKGDFDFNLNTRVGLTTRYFSAYQRMRIDDRLAEDPSYFGKEQGGFGARMEDAYGLVRFSALTFFLGRAARAWGPGSSGGSLVSANPYSYDHIGFQVETRHIAFSSLIARLDDTGFQNQIQKRYVSSHRLDVRFSERYQFGVSESSIYGGADAGFDPALMNPFGFLHEVQLNSGKEANTLYTFDWWIRPLKKTVFYGEFLLDDFVLDGSDQPPPNRDTSPDRVGMLLGAIVHDAGLENGALGVSYERVGSYTYNVKSKRPWQAFIYEGRGLGAPTNDVDRAVLTYRYHLSPKFRLSGDILYVRQGERTLAANDFEDSTFVNLDFPSGTVQRTWSVRFSLDVLPQADFNVGGFFGLDRIRNKEHVKGKDDTDFSFGLHLYVSRDFLFRWAD